MGPRRKKGRVRSQRRRKKAPKAIPRRAETAPGFDRKKLRLELDVKVAAHVNAISPAVEGIMRLVGKMKRRQGHEFEIEMALREALANAILHGARNDPDKMVECCVACDEKRGILIVVRDPGKGFDPASIPLPTRGQNIYSDHGRGIYLINQLMDEVKFHRGGTEIHMRKKTRPHPGKKRGK